MDVHAPPVDAFDRMGKPDTLIHLAWGGLPHYRALHHFETELPAQFRFLKGLVDAGLANLVVAGTCLEYGMQQGSLGERLLPQPTTAYGLAKDVLRRQLQFLQQAKPFNLSWTRLFYSFGTGQAESSLFSQLARAAARGERTFNMSGGEQLRDYLPIEEVARKLVDLALTGRDNGVVNVCSGMPISVRRLVEQWLKQNGWSMELNLGYYPYPDYEPLAFWGDPSKLRATLDAAAPAERP
jgi:dTDP-6-deoxy-L-talose 4-dehydrogenase (NAD+)